MLAAIAVLIAYAGLVGGGASVDRATLMAVVYFGGRAFDQRSPPLNGLWFVAARAGGGGPSRGRRSGLRSHLRRHPRHPRRRANRARASQRSTQNSQKSQRHVFSAGSAGSALYVVFVGMLAASVAAEALLFPVGALLFSRVTFAGLALNFLAIPLMAVAQVAGMAVVPLALISERLATSAGWLAHLGAGGLVWSADLVRFVPAVTWRVAAPAWGVVVSYYAALVVCWALWRRRSEVTGSAEPPSAARAPAIRAGGRRLSRRSGSSPNRWRFWRGGAMGVCTSRFWTSGRATARSCGFRAEPRCSWTRAGSAGRRASTSATGWWRPFCATAAFDASITSC